MSAARAKQRAGPSIDLGVLDIPLVPPGRSAADVLAESLRLAARAEALGYSRYWVAEHHNAGSAVASPEVLVPLLAARTRRIRVGTGGVLLQFYGSLKVAESFRLLEALFPGRIELGIGRGGTDPATTAALLEHDAGPPSGDRYRRKVLDLLGHLRGALPEGHALASVKAVPEGPHAPPVWLLGTKSESMTLAADLGTAFAFALFFQGASPDGEKILETYRAHFRPGPDLPAPRSALAVGALCARTEADAARLAARNKQPWIRYNVVGTPQACRAQLEDLAARHGTREILVATPCDDPKARLRSYELLARASSSA
jgi:luciferase family oxidoreductase group 1